VEKTWSRTNDDLRILARIAEHAYRREFRYGREAASKNPGAANLTDWFNQLLDQLPCRPGFAWDTDVTSLERLLLECARHPELAALFDE
jgi:hypothetical protein